MADTNTYDRHGAAVEEELRKRAFEVTTVILDDKELLVDARSVLRVLLAYNPSRYTFLAVGSGTITDIARFVSHGVVTFLFRSQQRPRSTATPRQTYP